MNTQWTSKVDDTQEDTYWRSRFQDEDYFEAGSSYDDYQGAYRTGYQGYGRHGGKSFDQAEPDLRNEWERAKGATQMGWDKAKHAVKAAWHRVERAMPGDADRDGR